MASKNVTISVGATDPELKLTFYVGPGGITTDLRVVLTTNRSDGLSESVEVLASAVTRTLSGITAGQALNFLRDCRNACVTAGGYT